MMDNNKIISTLLSNSFKWNRVNNQPCIHVFHGDYYVNLCMWNPGGVKTISIDVDDIGLGIDDIISLNIQEGDSNFEELMQVYSSAISNATNIAA